MIKNVSLDSVDKIFIELIGVSKDINIVVENKINTFNTNLEKIKKLKIFFNKTCHENKDNSEFKNKKVVLYISIVKKAAEMAEIGFKVGDVCKNAILVNEKLLNSAESFKKIIEDALSLSMNIIKNSDDTSSSSVSKKNELEKSRKYINIIKYYSTMIDNVIIKINDIHKERLKIYDKIEYIKDEFNLK